MLWWIKCKIINMLFSKWYTVGLRLPHICPSCRLGNRLCCVSYNTMTQKCQLCKYIIMQQYFNWIYSQIIILWRLTRTGHAALGNKLKKSIKKAWSWSSWCPASRNSLKAHRYKDEIFSLGRKLQASLDTMGQYHNSSIYQ